MVHLRRIKICELIEKHTINWREECVLFGKMVCAIDKFRGSIWYLWQVKQNIWLVLLPLWLLLGQKIIFFFFKGKLILIIGEEKKFLLTLVVSLAGPCKLDWKRYINKKKRTNRNLLTCSVHTCETKVMTTNLKGWLELWLV